MNPTEPSIVVPIKLAQAIMDYLTARPFKEVAEMVSGLARAPRFQAEEKPPPEEKTT